MPSAQNTPNTCNDSMCGSGCKYHQVGKCRYDSVCSYCHNLVSFSLWCVDYQLCCRDVFVRLDLQQQKRVLDPNYTAKSTKDGASFAARGVNTCVTGDCMRGCWRHKSMSCHFGPDCRMCHNKDCCSAALDDVKSLRRKRREMPEPYPSLDRLTVNTCMKGDCFKGCQYEYRDDRECRLGTACSQCHHRVLALFWSH